MARDLETLETIGRELGAVIADALKARVGEPTGFALFVFDFGPHGNLTYLSNAERADMVLAVKEWLVHQLLPGDPDPTSCPVTIVGHHGRKVTI